MKRQANRQAVRPRALGLRLGCRVNPLTKRAVFNPGALFPLCPSAENLMGCRGCCRGTLSLLKRWALVEPAQCHWARHFLVLEDGVMSESTSLERCWLHPISPNKVWNYSLCRTMLFKFIHFCLFYIPKMQYHFTQGRNGKKGLVQIPKYKLDNVTYLQWANDWSILEYI